MVLDGRQVEVEEHEQIVERVGAIGVAKASGMVCTRIPHPTTPGKRITRVWEVAATTNAIIALADQLTRQGIERVVVESTSDYWRGVVYLLEARGLWVWLVNARDVKQVPGRPKTDKLDAVWLAKLNERGMLRPSFIPPAQIRQLRDYTRLRSDLTQERSRHVQRLEKLLEDALIKLSTVATDIVGVSGRSMLAALIVGQRDPKVLAELAKYPGRVLTHAHLLRSAWGPAQENQADYLRVAIRALRQKLEALKAEDLARARWSRARCKSASWRVTSPELWEKYEKAVPGGRTALYIRLPVQLLFIAWAYAAGDWD